MKCRILSLAAISAFSLVSFTSYAADQATSTTTTVTTETAAAKPAETQNAAPVQSSALPTETDRISYAIGADIGHNFKREGVTLSPEMMAKGVKDATTGEKMLMDAKEIQTTLVSFQKDLIAKHQAKMQQASEKNKTEGEAFLAENKTKPGVETLPDGLQYKIIKAGSGESPTAKDAVTVNYEGTLIDGQVFDSSYKRGKPISFQVSEVIPGWTEALQKMKPGAEWMIYVPSSLGYGERGAGPIGPNQTLIFKIELISVQPATGATATATETKPVTTETKTETKVTTSSSEDKK